MTKIDGNRNLNYIIKKQGEGLIAYW